MGIFDFVKDAGASLARKVGLGGPDPDDLKKAVTDYGIEISDLAITVEDDVATISGAAVNRAHKEKAVLIVGNTKGIARVKDEITLPPPPPAAEQAPPPEPEAQFYTVVRGDTLSKIARDHYGSAGKYPVIFEANRPMLEPPDRIYRGLVLRSPPLSDTPVA